MNEQSIYFESIFIWQTPVWSAEMYYCICWQCACLHVIVDPSAWLFPPGKSKQTNKNYQTLQRDKVGEETGLLANYISITKKFQTFWFLDKVSSEIKNDEFFCPHYETSLWFKKYFSRPISPCLDENIPTKYFKYFQLICYYWQL